MCNRIRNIDRVTRAGTRRFHSFPAYRLLRPLLPRQHPVSIVAKFHRYVNAVSRRGSALSPFANNPWSARCSLQQSIFEDNSFEIPEDYVRGVYRRSNPFKTFAMDLLSLALSAMPIYEFEEDARRSILRIQLGGIGQSGASCFFLITRQPWMAMGILEVGHRRRESVDGGEVSWRQPTTCVWVERSCHQKARVAT